LFDANSVADLVGRVVKIGIRIVRSSSARLSTNVPELIGRPENITGVTLAIGDKGAISKRDQVGKKQKTTNDVSALTEVLAQWPVFKILHIKLLIFIFLGHSLK
jgi:hypothetical protein